MIVLLGVSLADVIPPLSTDGLEVLSVVLGLLLIAVLAALVQLSR